MNIFFSDRATPIPVKPGQHVLDALKEAGIFLNASCGGKGTCGKCKVKLLEGKPVIKGRGKLTEEQRAEGIVLACQVYPEADIKIEVPEGSRLAVGEKIAVSKTEGLMDMAKAAGGGLEPIVKGAHLQLSVPTIEDARSDLERLKMALADAGVEGMRFSRDFLAGMGKALRSANWDVSFRHAEGEAISIRPAASRTGFAIAVDIGTTTVVVYLINLADGKVLDVGSTYNSQIRFGDDVITRIVHATEGGGLEELAKTVRQDIKGITRALAGRHSVDRGEIELAVISGNTTMSHLFWGLDPGSIREEPYVPGVSIYPVLRGAEAGLFMNPQGAVYTFPSVASYVGGDIVSGVMASRMHTKPEIALFMDIGTNGEIAIGNNEWLITAACSAGPCFEGSGIIHGMRATEGAIESVKITGADFRVETGVIGPDGASGTAPRGICGSGMIDAISEMFLAGAVDMKGNLHQIQGSARIRRGENGMEFVIASTPAGDITLTEVDIENILRAKAAIYAGISTLVKEVGLTPDVIDRVYVAGGFGNYLNIERAIILGMLPDMQREKFTFLGNTSITGAYMAAVSGRFQEEAAEVAARMTYVELSVSHGFMDEYMSSLFLPHTDMGLFPTVQKLLKK